MADAERQGPLEVGQKFLKYTILEQIGRGGHAWVYHGHDPFLETDVAIKILHRHGGVTEDMLRRGRAEARLLYRLRHPNIVEVQDAGISGDGLLYIVMELLRGQSLRDVLRERRRLALREALELFLDLTRGVQAAHAFGAIHRDLKPENVFILDDGSSKILDFGIAKVVDAVGMTTERDVLHGTILYISPEQLEGQRATTQSDLYALGLMFFEVLHGRHPLLLKANDPTVRELSLMQIAFRPPRLSDLDANIPRHVARIVERLLLKTPAQRFESTQALTAAIVESLRRITEDASSPRLERAEAPAERAATGQDTERIPPELLPDRADSEPMTACVANEASRRADADSDRRGLFDFSDVTPLEPSPRAQKTAQPSSPPFSVPPVTTPIHVGAARHASSERESRRQRWIGALTAGAMVGVGLGSAYLAAQAYFIKHSLPGNVSAASVRMLEQRAAASRVSNAPTSDPTLPALVASTSNEPAPAPVLAAATPGPIVSPSVAAPSRRTPRPVHQRHRVTNSGKNEHSASASILDATAARKPWME
jgi:serine/threonine-protein kinase